MHALVTGGLGYIGHAVTAELMAAGWQVTALSRGTDETGEPSASGANVVVGDLVDRARMTEIVTGGGYDTIVHLGGLARARESFHEPLAYFDVNVGGTANLLHALDEVPDAQRPSLIYASTTLVYGSRYVGAVDENHEPSPESPYADTKVAAERLIAAQAITGRLAAVILRVFNVGGGVNGVADADPTRIIPNLLRVASGETKSVTLVGNGTAIRDFVHVADVAKAVRLATGVVRTGACPTYNIGSGVGSRIVDVLRCVEDVTGHSLEIANTPQDGAPARLIADIRYATGHLDWTPDSSDLRTIISDAWKCWKQG
jgi:UDP-glucose 4-epimerase